MFRAVEASPGTEVHFYCSSGGNAGLACATSAIALSRKATIVVPLTTPAHMIAKLRDLGADVIQIGANWAAADRHLREELLVNHDPKSKGVYVPPFDHPDIWEGAATLVEELTRQVDAPIDGIVCNVGGGGLLCGIMEGLEGLKSRNSWQAEAPVPRVLAIETAGADSLYACVQAGEMVTLPKITSIATSLGATRVAEQAFKWTQRAGDGLVCSVLSDADAVMGSARFLDDARIFVEVACGATIASVYNGSLRTNLGNGLSDEEWAKKNIVVVVCGGSNINLKMLEDYKAKYGV
ncbi:putative l-serine dehydratase protein [Phaeoacremonium minimum UCRPA7]|uniref:L-serine ammonia-lyase n=1 Tax=Phaeoacremonium minimum (strain UCR-PA7) TaxID=1286976 RepID=R8BE47_PHAM7|nr:putative l-serine dehydratase protein [Phaeoacremonium minimum UCRPA7]EON97572.1 putative l-serine dehydratase protein [Phaeoacremonium minimum UCRPA7]